MLLGGSQHRLWGGFYVTCLLLRLLVLLYDYPNLSDAEICSLSILRNDWRAEKVWSDLQSRKASQTPASPGHARNINKPRRSIEVALVKAVPSLFVKCCLLVIASAHRFLKVQHTLYKCNVRGEGR